MHSAKSSPNIHDQSKPARYRYQILKGVSKLQIAFEDKTQPDDKAEHIR